MFFLRSVYYFLIIHAFGVNIKAHATDFELVDRSFVEVLRRIKTNNPFLRGIISEYASTIDYVYYVQENRKRGRSKFNLSKYYDFAICGITQFSRKLPRRAIVLSTIVLIALVLEFFLGFLPKRGEAASAADSVLLRCMFVVLCLAVILFSVMFEFIIAVIDNALEKPLVVEEKRIKY